MSWPRIQWGTAVCFASVLVVAAGRVQAGNTLGVVLDSGSSNPFGAYLTEILKAEGFGNFQTEDLGGLTLASLQSYETVILSRASLSNSEAQLFRDYVAGGGNLVAMRPDSKLYDVFGIAGQAGTLSEGYIKIDGATPIGAGLETTRSLKMHGAADGYQLESRATELAALYSKSFLDTGHASVARSSWGSGQAVAFSYDLARSIVYTRQGNPEWAGQNRDGDKRVRASDLFYDTEGSNHWNDITKADILQADEQMRLLTHAIETLNAATSPLPRLWYFPDAKKSVLVWTGDQDNGTVQSVRDEFDAVAARGGNASIYQMGPYPGAADVAGWVDQGHEFGVHANNAAEDPNATWDGMNATYAAQFGTFQSKYPDAPGQKTIRNHGVKWCGTDASGQPEFAAQARIEMNYGIEMDFNYYFNADKWAQLGQSGYTIASGLPMRFATSTGQILDIYQADTQITDEGWKYQASAAYQTLLEASLYQDHYAWIVANFHPVCWGGSYNYSVEGEAMLDLAAANGIPIWSGEQMNSFVRMRDAAEFQNIEWDGLGLSFLVDAPLSGEGALTVMLPYAFGDRTLEDVAVAGLNVDYTVETIAGVEYALFLVGTGTSAINAAYVPEPVSLILLATGGLVVLWGSRRSAAP